MSAQTEQLEREAEAARARLSATVDELRGRLTPGQALDEILAYSREGAAGEFFRNLGRDIARNPLPVTLAGAGLAWLMLARNGRADGEAHWVRRRANGDTEADAVDGDFTAGVLAGAGTAANYVSERARAAADGIAEMSASTAETTGAAYRAVTGKAQDFGHAISESTHHAADRAGAIWRGVTGLCREQPLLLAGIGITLGALLGAVLLRGDAEEPEMDSAADGLNDPGTPLASESYASDLPVQEDDGYAGGPLNLDERSQGRLPTGNAMGLT